MVLVPKHSHVTCFKNFQKRPLLCSLLAQKLQLSVIDASTVLVPLKLSLVFLCVAFLWGQLLRPNAGCWLNTGNFHLHDASDKKVVLLNSYPSTTAGEGMCQRSGGLWALGKVNYKRIDSISQRLSNMPQPCVQPTQWAAQGKAHGGVVFMFLFMFFSFNAAQLTTPQFPLTSPSWQMGLDQLLGNFGTGICHLEEKAPRE